MLHNTLQYFTIFTILDYNTVDNFINLYKTLQSCTRSAPIRSAPTRGVPTRSARLTNPQPQRTNVRQLAGLSQQSTQIPGNSRETIRNHGTNLAAHQFAAHQPAALVWRRQNLAILHFTKLYLQRTNLQRTNPREIMANHWQSREFQGIPEHSPD